MSKYRSKFLLGALLCLMSRVLFAQSNVTLYGQVDAWVGAQAGPGQAHAWVQGGGGMSTSYWGMKGSEALGAGTKTVFTLESFFRPESGAEGSFNGEAFFARSANVGLSNDRYGQILIGRIVSPYFVSAVLFNPFIDSYTFSPTVMQTYLGLAGQGLVGGYGWDNAVMYSSPSFNGLRGNIIYAFGGKPGAAGQNKWGGNLLYTHGALSATLAFERMRYSNTPGDLSNIASSFSAQDDWLLGLSYDFARFKLYGQYQFIDNQIETGDVRMNGGQLGIAVPLAGGRLLGSYMLTRSTGASRARRNTWAAGYDYPLSKLTDVYAAYNADHLSGLSTGSTYGVGIRTRF